MRPFLVARVEMRLRETRSGTHVTMIEKPVGGLYVLTRNPLGDRLMELRNAESLRRLKRMAENGRRA